MKAKPLPSLSFLHAKFSCDAENGELYRKTSSGLQKVTPNPSDKGYLKVKFHDKLWPIHRLIWAMCNGKDPGVDFVVDHINGNRSDNRITNLRLATKSQNAHNSKVRQSNKSGVKGVRLHRGKLWCVKHPTLPRVLYFPNFEDAVAVRRLAEAKCIGEFSFGSECNPTSPSLLSNKRTVEMLKQLENKRPPKNKSGVKGVCFNKRDNKWSAYININGKQCVKNYKEFEHAIAARCLAEYRLKTNAIKSPKES